MKQLNEQDIIKLTLSLLKNTETFWADWSDQEETLKTIECIYKVIIMYPIPHGSEVGVYNICHTTGDLTWLYTFHCKRLSSIKCGKALFNDDETDNRNELITGVTEQENRMACAGRT